MTAPQSPDRLTPAQEHRLALAVTDALDAGSEHLPYRVTLRLEQARQAALSRAAERSTALQPQSAHPVLPLSAAGGAAVARLGGPGRLSGAENSLWWRFGSVAMPLMIVIAGLIGIAVWHEADEVVDLAEVDGGLVLNGDDLPLSAIADRGFGVFLRNTRQ